VLQRRVPPRVILVHKVRVDPADVQQARGLSQPRWRLASLNAGGDLVLPLRRGVRFFFLRVGLACASREDGGRSPPLPATAGARGGKDWAEGLHR
jgi:hypothetical protein